MGRYKTTKGEKTAELDVILSDGHKTTMKAKLPSDTWFYPVEEIDERVNLMGMFQALSKICKSSADITIMGSILDYANSRNEILLLSITDIANDLGVSRKQLTVLLKRAEDVNLLHKLGTGRYLLNPYKILGAYASQTNYENQELIQVRWKEITGLITEKEMENLLELSKHLGLENGLRPTKFNLNVAGQFKTKQQLSDKQMKALIKHNKIKDSK